jgi:hypothetical protein
MEEVQQNSVIQQVAPESTENHDPNTNQLPESTNSVEDRQDRNWKEMRRRQNDLEKDLKMQREMNEKLMQLATQANPVNQEVDELESLSDDEFIPKGKVRKLVQREKEQIKKEAVEEVHKILKQREDLKFMDRLKGKYTDFDEVVNSETMALLEEQDPELATTIADLKDPYKIGMQCYKYMKAMNLSEKIPQSRRAKELEKKLEQNAKTVQSPQVYDKRPMAQAFQMSKAELSNIYKEMMNYAAGSY